MSEMTIPELLVEWKNRLVNNTSNAFRDMKPEGYIRLVIIVGTYALIRPYLMKLGARMQERQHERDAADTGADIHPNELRTGKKFAIPGVDDSDDEEETEAQPAEWGKAARVRQRKFIRKALEKQEKKLQDEQEAESDKEIEDLLIG